MIIFNVKHSTTRFMKDIEVSRIRQKGKTPSEVKQKHRLIQMQIFTFETESTIPGLYYL